MSLCSRRACASFLYGVSNVVRLCAALVRPKKRTRKAKLDARIKRRILRAARTGMYKASELCNQYDAAVTVRRIQEMLREDAFLGF